MNIAYLGPPGTNTYEACKKYMDTTKANAIPYKNIYETIQAVKLGEVECAVVPIENSNGGGVCETIDTILEEKELYIMDELVLPIKHYLLASSQTKIEEINEVYSHSQAFKQCQNQLMEICGNVKQIEVASTAAAAIEVQKKTNAACIAPLSCGEIYNLEILKKDIQDNESNETKFVVIAKNGNLSILEYLKKSKLI